MINERRRYKNATDKRRKEKYKKLKNAINKEYKKSYKIFFNNICQDINEALKLGLLDMVYEMIKRFFWEKIS